MPQYFDHFELKIHPITIGSSTVYNVDSQTARTINDWNNLCFCVEFDGALVQNKLIAVSQEYIMFHLLPNALTIDWKVHY